MNNDVTVIVPETFYLLNLVRALQDAGFRVQIKKVDSVTINPQSEIASLFTDYPMNLTPVAFAPGEINSPFDHTL